MGSELSTIQSCWVERFATKSMGRQMNADGARGQKSKV